MKCVVCGFDFQAKPLDHSYQLKTAVHNHLGSHSPGEEKRVQIGLDSLRGFAGDFIVTYSCSHCLKHVLELDRLILEEEFDETLDEIRFNPSELNFYSQEAQPSHSVMQDDFMDSSSENEMDYGGFDPGSSLTVMQSLIHFCTQTWEERISRLLKVSART